MGLCVRVHVRRTERVNPQSSVHRRVHMRVQKHGRERTERVNSKSSTSPCASTFAVRCTTHHPKVTTPLPFTASLCFCVSVCVSLLSLHIPPQFHSSIRYAL